MGLIALNCPNCGAQLEAEAGRDMYFCTYCGAKIIEEKTRIEVSGNVSINGVATGESLINRAESLLGIMNYQKASEILEQVLSMDPYNGRALKMKMLCAAECTSFADLVRRKRFNLEDENYLLLKKCNCDETLKELVSEIPQEYWDDIVRIVRNRIYSSEEGRIAAPWKKDAVFSLIRDYAPEDKKNAIEELGKLDAKMIGYLDARDRARSLKKNLHFWEAEEKKELDGIIRNSEKNIDILQEKIKKAKL